MPTALVTDDGWRVEVILLDRGYGPQQYYSLTFGGTPTGPMLTKSLKSAGLYRDLSIVQSTMGDAFARLTEEN